MTDIIKVPDELELDVNSILVRYIHDLLHNDKDHFLSLFYGKPNLGKSWSALYLCEQVDPDFSAERIFFKTSEFLKFLKEQKPKPGSAVLMDEATRTLSSRSFMQKEQRKFVVFSQASRVLGLFTAYTSPSDSLDKQIRELLHMRAEAISKSREEGYVAFKIMLNDFQINWKTQEPLFRYPNINWRGEQFRCKTLKFYAPSVKLRHEYEKMKMENLEQIIDEAMPEMVKEETAGLSIKDQLQPFVEEVISHPEKFKTNKGIGFDWIKIQLHFNTTESKAKKIRMLASQPSASSAGRGSSILKTE